MMIQIDLLHLAISCALDHIFFLCRPSDSIVSEDAGIEAEAKFLVPDWPVRQPYAIVDSTLKSGTKNLACGLLRQRHWQSDAQTTRPDLIYSRPDLIYSRPDLIYNRPDLIYSRPDLIYSRPVLIYSRPDLSRPNLIHMR
jgi:hypothetical protein